jgi:hypothetical protein
MFLKVSGTGFEVLALVRIHNEVWVRTPYSLVHGYECSWRSILGLSSKAIRRYRQYVLNETSVTNLQITRRVTQNTIILNLNTPRFPKTVSQFITKQVHTDVLFFLPNILN